MIVTAAEYQTKIDKSKTEALISDALATAQGVVERHLGYSLEAGDYVLPFTGFTFPTYCLKNYQINSVSSVTLNGVALSPDTDYFLDRYFLSLNRYIFRHDKIVVSFNAGWTSANCPIKLTIMLIAQSILSSIGAGGISASTNFGQGGTITYDNSKYFKYFANIENYRIRLI